MENITLNSTDEEILTVAKNHANGNPGVATGHEMKLSYALNLLIVKQQKKLIEDQNNFNKKQIKWTGGLVIGTWTLAIATFLLVLITK